MSDGEPILIRTKLAPPRIGRAPVARERLLERLEARPDHRLCLVQGPAGSGKTMLLTQLRQRLVKSGVTVAWYNAASDDDDMQIAAYIVESLREAGVDLGREGLHAYLRSGGKAGKALLASLVNDLEGHDKPVVLVIDDFHNVPSFGMFALIDRWLALAPDGFRLVLGTRSRPPLDLPQLRARDQLTEISFESLRFDLTETRRFLEGRGVERLDAAQVQTLHDIADGWAAGLQLLTFSLRQESPAAFLAREATLSLSQEQALRDYLERAAIRQLPPDDLEFLVRIAACRRFNRELCELLTGDPRAGDRLARLEGEGLFLLPIDTRDAQPWYRFHRLFASFLRHRLLAMGEAKVRELNRLASRWFAAHDLPLEAFRHASYAADVDLQLDLLARSARSLVNGAQFLHLLRSCERVPADRLAERLELCLCIGWAQLSCGRLAAFDGTIADIERHPDAQRHDAALEIRLLKAYRAMRQDDTAAQLQLVTPMLGEAPPANAFHALILYTIAGLGSVYANRFEDAREIVRQRVRNDGAGKTAAPRPFLDMVQGFSHLVQGNVRLAADHLSPVFEATQRASGLGGDAVGLLACYLIEASYQLDEIGRTRDLLERHGELIEAIAAADGLIYALRVRARLEQLDGDAAAAQRTILRLEEMGLRLGLDRLVAWSLHDQLVLLAPPQAAVRAELSKRLDRLADRYRDHDGSWGEIPLAAAMAAAESAVGAERIVALGHAESRCAALGRRLPAVRMGLLRAQSLLDHGDRAQAVALGTRFVDEARQAGMKRLLADLGTAVQPLVEALLTSERGSPIEIFLRERHPPSRAPAGRAGPDPLSPRERDVLLLLGRALSTKSIARELDLSAGTVKWHLKNVYGKLDAVSREDALAKARALGIVP